MVNVNYSLDIKPKLLNIMDVLSVLMQGLQQTSMNLPQYAILEAIYVCIGKQDDATGVLEWPTVAEIAAMLKVDAGWCRNVINAMPWVEQTDEKPKRVIMTADGQARFNKMHDFIRQELGTIVSLVSK